MDRRNVNPDFKFGDSDGFLLTDIDTDDSLMLIPCDTAGNFSWTGVTRAPLQRNALQTSSTSNQYSDIERPWISIPQEEWNGGRGNKTFTKDTTRYFDGKRSQTAFNSVIYNCPLDYYSTGFRKAVTNCPGSLSWLTLKGSRKSASVGFTASETFTIGEIYIHLRRRGTPAYPLTVELKDGNSNIIAWHQYTTAEITDTLAEFIKFEVSPSVSLTAGNTYRLYVSSEKANTDNYWQVGVNTNTNALYYRIAEAQTGYESKFFMYKQVMFMIRQKPNGTPKLYINGYLGKATGGGNDTVIKTNAGWISNQWKGARIGLTFGQASANQNTAWKQITGNNSTTLTVDSQWDYGSTYPSSDTEFVIVDTPLWTEITGHGLTAAVTDIHVVRDAVYFCQGDYVNARKMRFANGSYQFQSMNINASFLCSVRDSAGIMMYRGMNNSQHGMRVVDRARLLDWDDTDTGWTTITNAITTQEPIEKDETHNTVTEVVEPEEEIQTTTESEFEGTTISDLSGKKLQLKQTKTETQVGDDVIVSTIDEITESGNLPDTSAGDDASIYQKVLVCIVKKDGKMIIGTISSGFSLDPEDSTSPYLQYLQQLLPTLSGTGTGNINTSSQGGTNGVQIRIIPADGSAAVTVDLDDIASIAPGEGNNFVITMKNGTVYTGTISYEPGPSPTPQTTITITTLDGETVTVRQADIARMYFLKGTYKKVEKHSKLKAAVQPKQTTVTSTDTYTVGGVTVTDSVTETTDSSTEVTVDNQGNKHTTTTDQVTKHIVKHPQPPLRTCIVTESHDFGYGDIDARRYIVNINSLAAENNTGQCVITLQESEDNLAFQNVQSVVATSTGSWHITAKCQYRYRRFMLTAVGTNCTVNNISITSSHILRFEDPVFLLDNYGKITRLYEYGAEQYKSLWIFQEGMVSSINKVEGTIDTYTHDRINLDELAVTADEWNGKAVNSTDVYLSWSWLNGWQRYYNTQLEGKGPDHDEGLPFERQGRVTQIVSYPSNVFISIDGEEGYSCITQFNNSGWNELYRAPNACERIHDMAFQPIYGKRPDRLWISVGDDVVWLAMPSKILYAIQDNEAEYTHESVLVSAWITAGMEDIDKLWQSLKIMADFLDGENCLVEADYQLDEEKTWHPIKNAYVESPSQKEVFSTQKSVNGKKMRYRLRLQTTDMHKTPKVNVVVIEAVGRIDIKQSYTFYFRNIKYKRDLNGGWEDIEPLEVQNMLDMWANKIKKLRLNSRWKIYDDKIVYLDAVQTSVLNELSEGYIAQITLNEL